MRARRGSAVTADEPSSSDGNRSENLDQEDQPVRPSERDSDKNDEKKSTDDERESEELDRTHQGKTEASDAPGSAEFRKRDRIIREQRLLGEQALSGSSRGIITAHGPVAMGDSGIAIGTAYFSALERQRVPRKGPLSHKWLDERRARFVETVAYHNLVEHLTQCRVLVLQGPDGSGRTTTALLALDRVISSVGQVTHGLHQESNVEMLDSEPDAITEGDLQEGHGYLLDRSNTNFEGQLNLAFLGQLKKLANDCNAFLVLIVNDRMPLDQDNLGEYLVLQDRPDPTEVLKAHLRCLKGGADVPWTDELHDEVNRELKAAPAPGRVVELAQYLADAASRELSGDDILAGFGKRLMDRARAKLARPFGDDDKQEPRSRTEVLCRRAQLIACSVLDGMPLVTVMDAAISLANWLYRAQIGQTDGRSLPRPVFSGTVDGLLESAEAIDHLEDETPNSEAVTRKIRMRPGLSARVFEIAWRDYDSVHKPLLDWLQELALHQDYALRVRAAIAVGKLASYDFDYIFDNVIDQWAGCSECAIHRWAAAWALEMAAYDSSLEARVRDQVGGWCRKSSHERQRTALLAFTTTIGVRHVEDTAEGLRLLATHADHAHDYALALAVREIFLAGSHEIAREMLDAWADRDKNSHEPPLAVQAARSLLALSEGTNEPSGDTAPDLMFLFADDAKWRDTATKVWRLALKEPATSEAGWNVLRLWLRRGGQEPRLVEPLIGLVMELARDPGLRSRLRFRQLFWNTNKATRHPVADDVLTRALRGSAAWSY
jgi:hypothetical protein